jgi:hypothetical protein
MIFLRVRDAAKAPQQGRNPPLSLAHGGLRYADPPDALLA